MRPQGPGHNRGRRTGGDRGCRRAARRPVAATAASRRRRSHPDTSNGQKLFSQTCGSLPHACRRRERAERSARTSTTRSRARGRRAIGRARSRTSSSTRSASARRRPLAPYTTGKEFTSKKCLDPERRRLLRHADAGEHRHRPGRDRRRRLCRVGRRDERLSPGRPGTARQRRRGDLQGRRLRRLPHAQGRGLDGDHRAGPRTAIAADARAATCARGLHRGVDRQPERVHRERLQDGIMPAFKGTLTTAQIKAVAQYVVSNAGK